MNNMVCAMLNNIGDPVVRPSVCSILPASLSISHRAGARNLIAVHAILIERAVSSCLPPLSASTTAGERCVLLREKNKKPFLSTRAARPGQ